MLLFSLFWDKWFGTFQEELDDEPPVYGIKKPARTWNPVVINYAHQFNFLKMHGKQKMG